MTEKIQNAISGPLIDIVFKGIVILVIPWSIWVTESLYATKAFMNRGDRFSAADGYRLEFLIFGESAKMRELVNQFEREFTSKFVRHSELKNVLYQWHIENEQEE